MMNLLLAQASNPSFPDAKGISGENLPRILPACAQTAEGCTTLAQAMTLFTNVSEIILGAVGMVLLGTFVYGGFLFVLSRGDQSQVKKAQKVLSASVIGLVIIFTAYTVISYGVSKLTGAPEVPAPAYEICTAETEGEFCGPNSVCLDGACVLFNETNP